VKFSCGITNLYTNKENMKPIILTVLIFLTVSCAVKKTQRDLTNQFSRITFGNSGGFSGVINVYLLMSNGEVYKIKNVDTLKINQINKKEIQDISRFIKSSSFKDRNLNETGNMTYFIEVKTLKFNKKVSWGENSQASELRELYKKLSSTLKIK